jgi:Gram-negative bacterial TonB protein C-terminal
MAIVLAGWLLWRYDVVPFGVVAAHVPVPEDGRVLSGIYINDYFDLSFPLPEGWTEGQPGPEPSDAGYYVLSSLIPKSELNATILIAAQDMFFTRGPRGDMAEVVRDFRRSMSQIDGMTIDREPAEAKIADRLLYRVDFSGVGLYRATFTTGIRCHAVSFNLTARSPDLLADLAQSLDKLSTAGKPKSGVPQCIGNYATPDNLVQSVPPAPVVGPNTRIPVRFVIDTQGGVKQTHVIHANPAQRKSIEEALRQWKFKPYRLNERAVEIETGHVFQFSAAGT